MVEIVKSLARWIGVATVACLLAGQAVAAQGIWVKKEFNQWTEDELKKFMSDSPWVKKMDVPRSTGPETTVFLPVVISWESALPVRQANIRSRMGQPGDVPAEAKSYLEQAPEGYVIRLSGLPADMVAAIQGDPRAPQGSILKIGKRQIALKGFGWAQAVTAAAAGAATARGGRGGGAAGGGRGGPGTDFLFTFANDAPIKLEEGDNVEVVAQFGSLKISKAFKLKDMVIDGKLVL